jgi:hypothetical protein
VDAAHARGLAVILGVAYNLLGPEGNYLPVFTSGRTFSGRARRSRRLNPRHRGNGPESGSRTARDGIVSQQQARCVRRSTDPPIHRSTDPPIRRSADPPIPRSPDPPIPRSLDSPIPRFPDPPIRRLQPPVETGG